jgi:hypothetical protein
MGQVFIQGLVFHRSHMQRTYLLLYINKLGRFILKRLKDMYLKYNMVSLRISLTGYHPQYRI